MMYNAGLVLEGGGMRGVFTAGVLDAFLEKELEFSSIYGVSAGCCHACSYVAKQFGRAYRVNVSYLDDPRYCSVQSLLHTGNMFGADMLYSQIPNVYDPFDYQTANTYQGKFYATVTNVETGEAEYIRIKDFSRKMWAVRASSSLPLISKTLIVKGTPYLDGGIADSIPICRSMEDGNVKNVVILTREDGYVKEPNSSMPLMKLRYGKYKAFLKAAENRHLVYNGTIDFLKEEEEAGRVFVIRPEQTPDVGRIEKDVDKLQALYEEGLRVGRERMDALLEYLKK